MGTPTNLEALLKFFGWREIIGNYCKSLRLLEGIIRVRWISSAERRILSCGFLWKAIFLMICQRRQARNCADITHCRVKYESTVHLWYGFESFETTIVRFLYQVLKTNLQTSSLCIQCLMCAILHPARMNWIFKFRVSSQQEFTCTVQAVPAESSCNCWDHFTKLTIYPIYLMSGATIESLCPPLFQILTCCQSGRISCVVDLSGLSIPWTETNGRYCGWSSMEMASKVDLIAGPRMLCILVYWL